jgi:hypothetical protein
VRVGRDRQQVPAADLRDALSAAREQPRPSLQLVPCERAFAGVLAQGLVGVVRDEEEPVTALGDTGDLLVVCDCD